MRARFVVRVVLAAAVSSILSGCLASALVGGVISNEMVGPPGSASYSTTASPDVVTHSLQFELTKIGSVQKVDAATGSIVGFDAQKHYEYMAKVQPGHEGAGSTVDLKVILVVGAITVGKVKTVGVMDNFVQELNASMPDTPLVQVKKAG